MYGKESRETHLLDIRLLVADVLALAQSELDNHQILVRNDILVGPPKVMAARVQLQQVILNLIMNAAEAMSSVTERDRRLTISSGLDPSTDGEASITITIEDTGSGIDPDHLDRIFDPFFTTKTQGMGLGLAISRSIVEAHGGRLWASRRSPVGTVFHLTLPVIPDGPGQVGGCRVSRADSAPSDTYHPIPTPGRDQSREDARGQSSLCPKRLTQNKPQKKWVSLALPHDSLRWFRITEGDTNGLDQNHPPTVWS